MLYTSRDDSVQSGGVGEQPNSWICAAQDGTLLFPHLRCITVKSMYMHHGSNVSVSDPMLVLDEHVIWLALDAVL